VPVGRRDVDDASAALRLHDAHLVLHAQNHAENIGLERRCKALRGLIRDRTNLSFGCGIVHRDIQTAEPRNGLVDHRADAWRTVLDDLVKRGLRRPELLIVDGGAGLESAIAAVWDRVPVQRCTVHKHRNLLAHAPERLHEEITDDYNEMIYAETREEIEKHRKAFIRKWRLKHEAVANSLEEPAIDFSLSRICHQASGAARAPRTRSNGYTRSPAYVEETRLGGPNRPPPQSIARMRSSGLTMHVNKVHRVTTITRVAEDLGENEDWIRDVANEMEIEDGVIWVYGVGEDGVMAFTDFGIENLVELIKMDKDNPTLLKRWHRPECAACLPCKPAPDAIAGQWRRLFTDVPRG
jgi:hypothetical protein